MPKQQQEPLPLSVIPRLLRFSYPFMSGLGTISNSKLLKTIDGNPPGDIIAKSGRFNLLIPQNDYVGRSIKYFGDLDKKISWLVEKSLEPGDTALDIGANLGLVSFKMLEKVGRSGNVIAFEPQRRMVSYINKSINLNQIENLHLHNIGLADKQKTLRLSIPEHNAGAATFVSGGATTFEEAQVTTLDTFNQNHDLENVKLVKVDVEGFEHEVFLGGKNFFSEVKPAVVVFEENRNVDNIPDSILTIQSYGYDIFSMPKTWFSATLLPYQKRAKAHDFVAIHKSASTSLRRKLGL